MSGLTTEELRELHQLREILDSGTFYDLFGIGRGFDRAQLRTSYYAISRRFHPDRFYRQDLGGHETLLEEVFAGINLAYRTLDEPEERKRYDREIGPKAPTAPPSSAPGSSAREKASAPPPVDQPRVVDTGDVPDSHTVEFQRPTDSSSEASSAGPRARARKKKPQRSSSAPPAVAALKTQLIRRLKRARVHYRGGEAAEAQNQWVSAASSYYLAHQYDPRNADYEAAYKRANGKARTIQAAQLVQLARNAEDYGSHREAIVYYEKACELNPPEGEAYYRLGMLLRRLDPDDRAVLDNLRAAVTKTSTRAEYRLALAEVYESTGMKLNANREFQAALKLEPGNDTAKSGLRRTR